MWTHTFTNFSFDEQEQQKYAETIEELKQEVRGMLMATTTPLKQMMLIDTLERLGLAYHFETEIENNIEQINGAEDGVLQDNGLFAIALRFRLLRQHRHHVSCDVFNKFVDKDGKFEEALSRDHEGLLNLYEAAHVRFRGEIILKEAVKFTTHYLRRKKEELESPLKERVKRALEHPLHWEFPIVSARIFISIYDKDDSRDELLLKLAKINFKFMQNVYRKDLSQLSRWWNKFDLKSKLPHARDRLVEAYLWGVGYNYEPEYSLVRIGLAKGIQIIATMDDTYDNYATVNEAQLFTEVLDKWNAEEAERLPEYMTILYHFILSISEDYERDAMKVGKSFATSYFIESVKQLARAYNQELKWIMEKQLPPFEDYLKNSEITSCVYLMFASIIPGLKSVTQETINWVKGEPKLARSTALVGRYADDIGSQHRESKEGKVFTSLDCYIKQHGVSKQETLSKYAELLEGEWEDLNKEFVATNSMPKEITITFLNYARMCDATYNKNNTDAYSDCDAAKTNIITLFVDDILI